MRQPRPTPSPPAQAPAGAAFLTEDALYRQLALCLIGAAFCFSVSIAERIANLIGRLF